MKLSCDDILSFRCPRWADMPVVDLYIDQVVLFLQDSLSVFVKDEKTPMITATMVNNYVKLKALPPPVKKKYGKEHIASLFVICILKRFMSISEIGLAISGMQRKVSTCEGYDLFCDEFEAALKRAFVPGTEKLSLYYSDDQYEVAALRAMASAYADIILSERIMEAGRASAVKAISKEKNQNEKQEEKAAEKKTAKEKTAKEKTAKEKTDK